MAGIKVLLIDDEEELVTTLVERLGYRGISADYALDGYAALAKLREQSYTVVVLDLKLPGIDGIEVLRQIKSEYPGVPVILITGHGSPVENGRSETIGAYDYLIKPVKLEVLMQRIVDAAGQK